MEKKVEDQIDQLSKPKRSSDTNQNCSFIVNTIISANLDKESESESSDDDLDSESFDFDFEAKNVEQYPFRADDSGDIIIPLNLNISQNQNESKIILPFLNKLESTGLEIDSRENISDLISCFIFLNRPLSLSSRKNNILIKEFSANTQLSGIKHKVIAGFWSIIWKDKYDNIVDYSRVRKFYKKYKKVNAEEAKRFRELNEELNQNIQVPYQVLREFAKNDNFTSDFIREAKKKSQHVYLSFVDGDTLSFNGIYSSYLRLYNNFNTKPTVMSTGYEYSSKLQSDRPFIEASKLDRTIRIGIAEIFPEGVYYPEPNFYSKRGKKLESAVILGNLLKNRGDKLWIFANANPVLIEIPQRVRFIKNHKTIKIEFSSEFQNGELPTREDFIRFNQISQSSTDVLTIAKNLYINRAFDLDKPNHFNSVLTRLLDPYEHPSSRQLRMFLNNEDIFNKIEQIITKVRAIKSNYQTRYTNNLDRLKDYLGSECASYNDDNDGDVFLQAIGNYKTIVDDIINEKVSIDKIYEAYILEQYDLIQILEKYIENPLHLLFMSMYNPNIEISDYEKNPEIYRFGLENYVDDVDYVFDEYIYDNYQNEDE
ncbi:unnamed protein product [Brachionus calyciflorus]|uniref:Uncharacterized protein n=1 Tax=Brachionus calyciflorus TaxID=104777 RepID=A0A813VV70_9BILA|nr:unnamed protein product [Brachionus calyciflorus]